MDKPLTKRQIREQRAEKARNKQIEKAYEYPFCRRCRKKLDPIWAKELKKRGEIPLCEECLPAMMEMFKKVGELWQKFKA